MDAGHLRRVGALVVVTAVGATGFATVGASADSSAARAGGDATIKMKQQGRQLFFAGPNTVRRGAALEIVNKTDPQMIGPHTFSLVRKAELPTTERQMRKCGRGELRVCRRVAKAHRVSRQGVVRRNPAFAGDPGWDKAFGRRGDSWVSQEQDEDFGQKVSAKSGKRLFFLCVVHPEMQGKIKVLPKS